jgi:pyridoxal 5'-phosphate synthase pdxT subunit
VSQLKPLVHLHVAYPFVRVERKPTWGTCAGLILLAEAANQTKKGGQELIGGLDVRVNRNHFGRQVESFQAGLDLPFLSQPGESAENVPFPGIFIRAPIVEKILRNVDGVQVGEEKVAETVVAPSRAVQSEEARKSLSKEVDIMGRLPGRLEKSERSGGVVAAEGDSGDIIAVRQGNVFGTSFHPELTSDIRIHVWWLRQVMNACSR